MWEEFNIADKRGKHRPPTIIRIEVDVVNRKIAAVWELLQITKAAVFPLEGWSENDVSDVFTAVQTAIEALEQEEPPLRFVDGDAVEVWQILNDGGSRLLATATVSVTPLICSHCSCKQNSGVN